MNKLIIFVNNQAVFEFDRETRIEESKRAFLDKMDRDMSRGIKMQGESISDPNGQQRATFVAMNLIKGLQRNNRATVQASCTYLVCRMPALIEVRANDRDGKIIIELVEEKLD